MRRYTVGAEFVEEVEEEAVAQTPQTILSLPFRPADCAAIGFGILCGTNLVQTKTITDPATNTSRTWSYTYDSYGRVLTAKGPRTDVNSTTTYTYYTCAAGAQCGEVETVTDAVGNATTYNTYNAFGQPLTTTDPNGVVTTLTYDARQRLLSRTTAGETTSLAYYPTGLLQTVTLPDGATLHYTYDGAHRLIRVQDSLGNSTQYTLDAMGNQTAVTTFDPNGVLGTTQSRVYNVLNELYQVIGSAGTMAVTTTYGYDNDGNRVSINAPLSRNSAMTYDALNRIAQIADPNNGNTGLSYDANDNLIAVLDPIGLATTYQYDGLGDLLAQASPATGATVNAYDSGGNLATSQDARGITTAYTYDALNRVTQAAYGDETIVYGYDTGGGFGKGRLTSAADASHSLSWTYDALGRVVQKTLTVGNVTASVGYTYSNGDLVALITPSGQSVTFNYSNHQINTISVNGTPLLSGVTYEPFGPTEGWTWASGAVEIRMYDTDGNPSQFTGAEATTYAVDSAFRIIGITNDVNPGLSYTYNYDSLDRLTTASTSSAALGWSYDGDGNRLSQSGTSASDGTTTLGYNNRGRPVNVTTSAGSMTTIYDALGERIEKSSWLGVTVFMYDEAGHLLGEYDGSGNLIEETVWMGDLPVATLQPNGSGGINVFYVHADHLNTPKTITEPNGGAIVWRWDQDPFGTAAPNSNPSGIGTFSYNLRFPGQYFDAETGLNQNVNRDYDPQVGRYVESDPMGLKAGLNTYTYVGEDPIEFGDLVGLCNIKLRCGPVLRGGVTVGWHCGVVAPNGIEFGLGGGNSSGIAGTAVPYPQPNQPRTPTSAGPGQVEYPVTCGCQSCNDVQQCLESYHGTETPPPYFFAGPNSNTYAHHMVSHCHCSLGNGLASPPGATGWNFGFPSPLPYDNVVPAL